MDTTCVEVHDNALCRPIGIFFAMYTKADTAILLVMFFYLFI